MTSIKKKKTTRKFFFFFFFFFFEAATRTLVIHISKEKKKNKKHYTKDWPNTTQSSSHKVDGSHKAVHARKSRKGSQTGLATEKKK
uniref:Putative secreted protein n=1 Tax=Ixodes ricinus TaxID=34613 RepID=A0A6B0U142_IXORI